VALGRHSIAKRSLVESREEMVRELLAGMAEIETFHDEPHNVARQFISWVSAVETALGAAGMDVEQSTWKAASENIRFTEDSSAFVMHMKAMKAVLLGIYHRIGGSEASSEFLDPQLIDGTKTYVLKVLAQANGCYERGWYDASAVMLRKMIETLIIECFEAVGKESQAKNASGEYFQLGDLISAFLAEPSWHVSRNTRNSLPRLHEIKELGDKAAHSRRFVANRGDIDKFAKDLRTVVQELAYIVSAKAKK
jgi:hypothetical protein